MLRHPAALLKINNSSYWAPSSPHNLSLMWPTRSFLSLEASGFSWPLFYQRSQALQPHASRWRSNNVLLLLSMNVLFQSFLQRVQNPKEYPWWLRFHRCAAVLVWRCFGEETLSTSPICLLTETCPGYRSAGSQALTWGRNFTVFEKVGIENTLSVSRISWMLGNLSAYNLK